ncbi:hypothetical protein L598_000700001060 [Mesorhizobium sp. J18]|uniref:hypothetical protein n=1 Tax=Mesorhizobium sp. J18 TaxID=935263 RepID=UPI00119A5F36|nr:hypothetical protein [Mesorhizobium sp. J18]TWG90349.1 hypothetical protein L598_000700001060 [Mesorhizobium sp. J18]
MVRLPRWNFKWTVANTDIIRSMAEDGCDAYAIALHFTRLGKPATTDEILRICDDMGVKVRRTA